MAEMNLLSFTQVQVREEVYAKACTPAEYYGSETGAFIFQGFADCDDLPGNFVWSSGERKQELGFSTYCRYAVISGKEEKQK